MSDDLLSTYMQFLKFFRETVGGEVTVRFSGGDPIILGDRLFEISNITYKISGIKPYFLTAGKGIDAAWTEKAKRSAFTHAFVSLENPLAPDRGSVDPYLTMKKIRDFSSADFLLELGVTVVKNEEFKNIYEICRIVFEETGKLPKIQEMNYAPYETPTDHQLGELYENLVKVVSAFHGRADMDFFSYVSPEFSAAHDNRKSYLTELNMENAHNIGTISYDESLRLIQERQHLNYPESGCANSSCEWFDHCQTVKWLWKKPSATVSAENKIADYCRFKKIVNAAFYDALFPNEAILPSVSGLAPLLGTVIR